MLQSPETQAKIAMWRAKNKEGTMSLEDWKQCFEALRADRQAAQAATSASKARKAKAPARSAADLLGSLKSLAAK